MGARVLVVDDDTDSRSAMADVLLDEGYEVAEAENGLEALREIDRVSPDIVLLDLMMPVLDGWKTLQILRRTPRHKDLPVVVVSAVDPPGAVDHLQKPISRERLLAMVASRGKAAPV
ncbi:MAG TPA: response regulator [Polyangiaceae bacterium]|jgi:CheY-like chemotaxis protein